MACLEKSLLYQAAPMLFLYLSVIVALIIGAIAARIVAGQNKPWRPTFIITTIVSGIILFIVAFKFLVDHNVPNH